MRLKLQYPVQPVSIIQPFGANPTYYAKFIDSNGNPEKGHMGIDFMASHGQPVYAAHDGIAFYVGPDAHGGDGIYIRTETPDDEGNYYTTIYWHLCAMTDPQFKPLINAPVPVKAGDHIGYADNTGAPFESSGDHLHLGLVRCAPNGNFLNADNGYGGCIDPQPFFGATPAPAPSTPAVPLSASDQIAVFAAQKMAAGNTSQANILFALAKFLKAFGN